MKIIGFYSLIRSDEIVEAGAFELIDKEAREIALRLWQKYSLSPCGFEMRRTAENRVTMRFYFANSPCQLVFEFEIKER